MKKYQLSILCLFYLFSSTSTTYASVRVSLVGTLNSSQYAANAENTTYGTASQVAYGAMLEFKPIQYIGLEIGLFELPVTITTADTRATTIEDRYYLKYYQVPLLLRFWPLDFFSIGGGVFTTYAHDDAFRQRVTDGLVTATSNPSHAELSLKEKHWGYMGVVGFNVRVNPILSLLLEARYSKTNSDITTNNRNGSLTHAQYLVGVRIGGN